MSSFDGQIVTPTVDLDSDFKLLRTFGNIRPPRSAPFGPGWHDNIPTLTCRGDDVFVDLDVERHLSFSAAPEPGVTSDVRTYAATGRFTLIGTASRFVLTRDDGNQWIFYAASPEVPPDQVGLLVKTVHWNGYTLLYEWKSRAIRSIHAEAPAQGQVVFTYDGDHVVGVDADFPQHQHHHATLTYYYNKGRDGEFGPAGTLSNVHAEELLNGKASTSQTCYRYYTADGLNGYAGALKSVITPPLIRAALKNHVDPFTAPDAAIAPFCDRVYAYDGDHRVREQRQYSWGQAKGVRFTYSYGMRKGPLERNAWSRMMTTTVPNGDRTTLYLDGYGMVMISDFLRTDGRRFVAYWRYNDQGIAVVMRTSTSADSYDPSLATLVPPALTSQPAPGALAARVLTVADRSTATMEDTRSVQGYISSLEEFDLTEGAEAQTGSRLYRFFRNPNGTTSVNRPFMRIADYSRKVPETGMFTVTIAHMDTLMAHLADSDLLPAILDTRLVPSPEPIELLKKIRSIDAHMSVPSHRLRWQSGLWSFQANTVSAATAADIRKAIGEKPYCQDLEAIVVNGEGQDVTCDLDGYAATIGTTVLCLPMDSGRIAIWKVPESDADMTVVVDPRVRTPDAPDPGLLKTGGLERHAFTLGAHAVQHSWTISDSAQLAVPIDVDQLAAIPVHAVIAGCVGVDGMGLWPRLQEPLMTAIGRKMEWVGATGDVLPADLAVIDSRLATRFPHAPRLDEVVQSVKGTIAFAVTTDAGRAQLVVSVPRSPPLDQWMVAVNATGDGLAIVPATTPWGTCMIQRRRSAWIIGTTEKAVRDWDVPAGHGWIETNPDYAAFARTKGACLVIGGNLTTIIAGLGVPYLKQACTDTFGSPFFGYLWEQLLSRHPEIFGTETCICRWTPTDLIGEDHGYVITACWIARFVTYCLDRTAAFTHPSEGG